MAALAHRNSDRRSLLLPATLLVLISVALLGELGGVRFEMFSGAGAIIAPQTVTIASSSFVYHPSGDYEQAGQPAAAPAQTMQMTGLEITTYETSKADYARCVADAACKPARPRYGGNGDVPATGVSFNNANDYASWLSARTGESWRLPTMAEWDFAADGASSERGGHLAKTVDPDHPWLTDPDDQPAPPVSPFLRPLGAFGTNARGVADMNGNVWEWTNDCNSRNELAADGHVLKHAEFCGVRLLEGPARMPMSAFIQDARGGGCLATVPPDNLGFRLVREHRWYDGIIGALRRILGSA